jgi:hypothetical protein
MGEVTSIQTARKQSVTGRSETHIEKLLGEARLKLIETGRRNRLTHATSGSRRSRALAIASGDADQIFKTLVRRSKSLPFFVTGEVAEVQREPDCLKTPRLVASRASYQNGLQNRCRPSFCTSGSMGNIATRRPPKRSAASMCSFSLLVFCVGTKTKHPTCRATRL